MWAARSLGRVIGLVAVLLVLGACMELEIENPNEPDRDRALSTAGDVESLISGQFRTFWLLVQGRGPGPAMDALAEVESGNQANFGLQDQGEMPPIPIVNQVDYIWGYWVFDPFLFQNRGLAAIRDGLQAIESLDLQIAQGPRLQAFAKFIQGLFHGYQALQFDQAFIIDETVEDAEALELQPYGEVMAAARSYLAQARTIAGDNSFTLPDGWLGPRSYSNDELVRLAHSYEARFMAQGARNPTDRAQVDWNQVLNHIEQGVVQDFGVDLDGPGGRWNAVYKQRSSLNSDAHLALLGPADQSGAYIEWENTEFRDRLPFDVDTDDRRINDGTLRGPGKYAVWRDFFTNLPERGTWFLSNYARQWYKDIGDTGFGFAPELTVTEMNLLKAEAYIRLGDPEAALPLINETRVGVGELPPATLEGATGDRCVPRAIGPFAKASNVPEGECGDLWLTLLHETRMEKAFLSAGSVYYDARAFGTLRTGRAIHAPVPMADLQLLGIPHYTFGGVGGEGSAP